jgi:hypothetical protein
VYTPFGAAFPGGQLNDRKVSAAILSGFPEQDINAFAIKAVQLSALGMNVPVGDVAVRTVIVAPLTVE